MLQKPTARLEFVSDGESAEVHHPYLPSDNTSYVDFANKKVSSHKHIAWGGPFPLLPLDALLRKTPNHNI